MMNFVGLSIIVLWVVMPCDLEGCYWVLHPLKAIGSNLVALLPFVGTILNCISLVLSKYNIKTGHLSRKLQSSFLWPRKHQAYTAFALSVGWCSLDRVDVRLRSRLDSTTSISVYTIPISPQHKPRP